MKVRTLTAIPTNMIFSPICILPKYRLIPKTNTMANVAIFLARGLMTWCLSQSTIASPKYLLLVSHLCNLGDDFEKRNAAKITKGVVGRIGKKAPIIPKIKLKKPKPIRSLLFNSSFKRPLFFTDHLNDLTLARKSCRTCYF